MRTLRFGDRSSDEPYYRRMGEEIAIGRNQDSDQCTELVVYKGWGIECLTSSHLVTTCHPPGLESPQIHYHPETKNVVLLGNGVIAEVTVSESNKTSVIHGSAWSVEMDKAHQRMMQRQLKRKKDTGMDKREDIAKRACPSHA